MRATGLVIASTISALLATWLVASAWAQPRPSLQRAVRHLHRTTEPLGAGGDRHDPIAWFGATLAGTGLGDRVVHWTRPLRLVDRTVPDHLGRLAVGALLGLVGPSLAIAALTPLGLASPTMVVPVVVSVLGAVTVPLALHAETMARSESVRRDLRHQLTAFLDMVTMLLAGNSGHEGALQQAARNGDGMLFVELRRRMREMGTTGRSLIGALSAVGEEFGVVELEDVANAARLSASEGAPVARTLAAKCATLRSSLAADQEAAARIRNDKVTPPLVGMALLFMALVIYPALAL